MSILLSAKHSQIVFVPISEEFVFFVMSLANRLQAQWLTAFKLLPTEWLFDSYFCHGSKFEQN